MTSAKQPGGLITRVKKMMDPPFDPTLVENTPRLLDVLNKSDKLQKLFSKTDERGFTLLHLAAEKNQPESLKCLLIKDANPNVRSAVGTNEVTPLHIAASCGHLACLQLLVQAMGNIMAQDRRQLTPIDCANLSGQDFCLNYLTDVIAQRQAEEQADLEEVLMEVERNLVVDNIQTLNYWSRLNDMFPVVVNGGYDTLHDLTQKESMMYRQCILINSHDLVKVLSRIAKDIPISLHNASMLHAACRYRRVELARLLIRKFPSIILSVTNEGYHALHVAVAYKQIEICRIMVQTQVEWYQNRHLVSSRVHDVIAEDEPVPGKFGAATLSGHSVLHFAVAVNQLDILSLLLKRMKELQININAAECGYTALHLAVYLNNYSAVAMLLKKGANPNTCIDPKHDKLNISHTPLAEATVHRNLKILKAILDSGGEDKNHDAIKVCLPSPSHQELVVPLLGSLIKCDDGMRGNKQMARKERQSTRIKTGLIDWTNLQLTEVAASWISDSLPVCNFFRAQSIERSRLFQYITAVNLSNNCLVSLPAEVFNLPKMVVLNVSNNRLEAVPEVRPVQSSQEEPLEWPCAALSKVVLCRNSLTQVPEFLFQLPNLSQLDLSHNRITSLPFAVWTSPKLHQLNCSHNQLQIIPTNWPHVMDTCTIVDAPSVAPVPRSPHVKKRHSLPSASRLGHYTREVSNPCHSDNGTSSSTDDGGHKSEIASVSRLQDRLNICNANLPIEWESLDSKEEYLEGLALINFSHNRIRAIPDNLPCLCPKLVRLDLSHNEIVEISLPHSFPAGIKHLNLSHNRLTEVNSETASMRPLPCTSPQVLSDQGNQLLMDVSLCSHRFHSRLMSLGVLELNNCQLTTVNFHCSSAITGKGQGKNDDPLVQAITNISNKKSSNTRLIDRLVCPLLTRLILSHNQLSKVPESVCEMVSLNSLDLSHNDIIELPASLGNLCNLWEFPLNGLKLISPPHNIIERGKTKDIIGFLWSLLQKARPYHRMKLMLVGRAARGKTTLLQKISEKGQRGIQENWALARMAIPDRQKCDLSTVGIVVSDWTYYKKVRESQTSLKSITFMTWDFGGQEEYYATHQCFLSRRSLYLAVWNVTHGMEGAHELKPWLLNIQARAPHSPVIIIGTHTDKISTRSQRMELHTCLQFINNTYGSADDRKEGFPQIMRSVVVSCKTGRGINDLRDIIFDVASQVKENTVAGRGVGCGRIPEYRLLMDQLVPASYLQLEDTVRNIALSMRGRGKTPVLKYKELREMVFSDPRTLISKSTADRELEQAVRFLHDNGTLLHYEDPLLSDFYFVDPQWLCDMLAHLVTVREINPLVKDGIMRIADFPLIFNDQEFPISWQNEYIRLLTTFEVGVELEEGELLIPSALPLEKPPLPCTMFPETLKKLPSLRHTYIVPFVPSGFWPRLMSRILTDRAIVRLAIEGCCIREQDAAQLSWVKWRQGLMLQYGNITLMLIEELKGGMFLRKDSDGIKILRDDKWELHRKDIKIFGIDVVVPDVYPILKYPEVVKAERSHLRSGQHPTSGEPSEGSHETSHDLSRESHDPGGPEVKGTEDCVNKVVNIDQIDTEFQKLARRRTGLSHSSRCCLTLEAIERSGGRCPSPSLRTDSWERKMRTSSSERPSPFPRRLSDVKPQQEQPVVDEEKNDVMRAGMLSKAIEHITLLVEDWFTGVRPRHLIVPCPSCCSSNGTTMVLQRSFSNISSFLQEAEQKARGISLASPSEPDNHTSKGSKMAHSIPAPRKAHSGFRPSISSLFHRQATPAPQDSKNYCYAFRYDDCVVTARTSDNMVCPQHGSFPLRYLAPDTLFLTQGSSLIVASHDLIQEDSIGHGAFAKVFRARVRLKGHEEYSPAALKALTKERIVGSIPPEGAEPATPTKVLSRHSILEGFSNLKKELSVLSPLRHANVVCLLGVTLRPLGLLLELAPKGSLRALLQGYAEVQSRVQCNVAQAVIVQVAAAIKYLHSSSIIYRDLKSDNVLVWQFPDPQDSIPSGCPLGSDLVFVKLSDYGISQFVATQGAKGLVGTPGFMAPEIIKYHGREAYTAEVDIFSFGMFIYELLTLRIPYENLTAQQANQANESGARPSLTQKDLPCPVLLRELMVWCWQQNYEDRPTASKIIATAQTQQFLRLLDGIRVSNNGQVTATCLRRCTSGPAAHFLIRQKLGRRVSPVTTYTSKGSGSHSPLLDRSQSSTDPPGEVPRSPQATGRSSGLQSVSEEGDDVFESARVSAVPSSGRGPGERGAAILSQELGAYDSERSHSELPRNSDPSQSDMKQAPCTVGADQSQELRETEKLSLTDTDAMSNADSGFDSTFSLIQLRKSTDSKRLPGSLDGDTADSQPSGKPTRATVGSVGMRLPSTGAPTTATNPTTASTIPLQTNSSMSAIHHRSHSMGSTACPSVPAFGMQKVQQNSSQARHSSLESKKGWSPRVSEQSSFSFGFEPLTPSLRAWEEDTMFEIWVASSDAHHTVATVLEYSGKFVSVEEIEVGDSPVLCMCTVRDKVWMGFEIGYLIIFDASTRKLCAQAWVDEHTSVRSVIHLAALKRVYVALGNGSVLAYDDDISCVMTSVAPARVKLLPVQEYRHPNQSSSCLLAVPKSTTNLQTQPGFELWVGQKEGMITVLDADTLEVVKFIQNDFDQSRIPSYVAYLTFAHLVCSVSPELAANGASNQSQGEVPVINYPSSDSNIPRACVSVYGAVYHGQYVTRWNAEDKTAMENFNCKRHLDSQKDCSISCLHYSNLQLYVGLSCGKVLILDAITFDCLCQLSCHRDRVRSLVTIDLSQLQDSEFFSPYKKDGSLTRSYSMPPVAHSSPRGPSPIHLAEEVHRSPSLNSVQSQTANSGYQLLSFGTGFRSYFDGPESKQYLKSGFLLVWDAEQNKTTCPV